MRIASVRDDLKLAACQCARPGKRHEGGIAKTKTAVGPSERRVVPDRPGARARAGDTETEARGGLEALRALLARATGEPSSVVRQEGPLDHHPNLLVHRVATGSLRALDPRI